MAMENLNVLPKAFFVDSVEVLEGQAEVLSRISGQFEPSETAFVTQQPELNIQPDTTSAVSVTEYTPNQITLDISRTEPGFLVLSEIWYPPGWSATLDGVEIEIIRTNYVLRGFEVPAGEHTLEMTLNPAWYPMGWWIAMTSTVILFAIGGVGIVLMVGSRKKEVE